MGTRGQLTRFIAWRRPRRSPPADLLVDLRDGALGGLVATVAMSVPMVVAGRLGLIGRQAPEQISTTVAARVGAAPKSRGAADALATITHFVFGAGAGALFAVLHRKLRLPIPAVVHGVVYATAVWAVSYLGWVPVLRLMPKATQDENARQPVMLGAHWVYGATLAATVERLECRDR